MNYKAVQVGIIKAEKNINHQNECFTIINLQTKYINHRTIINFTDFSP
jgi:hypothetical protein